MKNIGLITDISFWEIGNGQNARIRELYNFLNNYSKLTLYYLEEDNNPIRLATNLEKAKHDFVIVEKIHLDWVLNLGVKNTLFYLDVHDLLSERAESFRQFNRNCASIFFEDEVARLSKFDKVIVSLKEEFEKLFPFLGKDRLLICPHPVIPDKDIVIRKQVESISFFGGPSWPNIDSIQWFHDAVLPLLGDLGQKCVVQGAFISSPFSVFLPRLNKGQLFSTLGSYYKNIDIAINPSLYGSGIKIKTVEALAYGIPLVTTSIGAQGFLEESGLSFLVADTPEEFASAIQSVAFSLTLRRKLSSRSRNFAEKHFTPYTCFGPLLE